jgi:Na+-transporting NADH:ubiquinone oxidoreductase subunit NqrA
LNVIALAGAALTVPRAMNTALVAAIDNLSQIVEIDINLSSESLNVGMKSLESAIATISYQEQLYISLAFNKSYKSLRKLDPLTILR